LPGTDWRCGLWADSIDQEVKLSVPGLSAEEDFPPDLAGRRAVVTGAARGIGEAIAKGLLSSGARVVAIDKDKDVLVSAFEGSPARRFRAIWLETTPPCSHSRYCRMGPSNFS
jgi:hypothetical protein